MARFEFRPLAVSALLTKAREGGLFAILDACDEPRVSDRVRAWGSERCVSLYRGSAEAELSAIAPYLIVVDESALEWIAASLWSEPWGILMASTESLEVLRTHWRRFLIVEGPDAVPLCFRFYDPRVLRRFLTLADPEVVEDFAAPITALGMTDPTDYGVLWAEKNGKPPTFESPAGRVTLRLRRPSGAESQPAGPTQ